MRWLTLIGVAAASLLVGLPRADAATFLVTMANYAFSPAGLTVHVGDRVTWTNQDAAPHDVTTTSAPVAIHSPTLERGDSWSYTFTTPGTYVYICSIHPDMHATITVAAAAPTTPASHPATHPTTAAPAATTPAPAPTTRMQMPAPVGPPPGSSARSSTRPPARAPTGASSHRAASAAPIPAASAAPAAANTSPASTSTSLNPLLLIAGLVAAVATLCLLLLASRPEPGS
jgi:plastocyanin